MTKAAHPAVFRLDALAAGDRDQEAAEHLVACPECRAYVESVTAEFLAAPRADAPMFVEEVVRAEQRRAVRRPAWVWAAASAVALAACLLLLVRTTGGPSTDLPTRAETHFKGGIQLAVIRDRDGHQERLATSLPARAGDRVRIELGVDSARPVEAGILATDGTWTLLLAPAELEAGVHYSEEGARFQDDAVEGWILAGAPEAVEDARKRRNFDAVRVIPIVAEPR
jgi:hypothetical protein